MFCKEMKYRYKVKQIPPVRPLWLKVIGNNLVEVDTDSALFANGKKLSESDVMKAVKVLCGSALKSET